MKYLGVHLLHLPNSFCCLLHSVELKTEIFQFCFHADFPLDLLHTLVKSAQKLGKFFCQNIFIFHCVPQRWLSFRKHAWLFVACKLFLTEGARRAKYCILQIYVKREIFEHTPKFSFSKGLCPPMLLLVNGKKMAIISLGGEFFSLPVSQLTPP